MAPGVERPDQLVTSSTEPPAGAKAGAFSVRRAAQELPAAGSGRLRPGSSRAIAPRALPVAMNAGKQQQHPGRRASSSRPSPARLLSASLHLFPL